MHVAQRAEFALVDGLLHATAERRSAVVIFEGEPGIGKTSLLDDAALHAGGRRVLRARGAPSETRLAFAGLGDLLRPLADRIADLPEFQARALRSALALDAEPVVDRFAVAVAAAAILASAADRDPLLLLVDDLHWLDVESAEAITFCARRLSSEPIVLLATARPDELDRDLVAHLRCERIAGLSALETRRLLEAETSQPVALDVAARLTAHTGGNPLALLELARQLAPPALAGLAPLDPIPAASVEDQYARRIGDLSAAARDALLVLALLDSPDPRTLGLALGLHGLDRSALDGAHDAGLLRVDATDHPVFRHPLVRAAVVNRASPAARRRAHLTIAGALAGETESDRRTLHLAAAAAAPDEELAAALEAAAHRARRQGGFASSARILEQSAELTPDPAARIRRLMDAGRDAALAGHEARARSLLDLAAELGGASPLQVEILALRGHVRAAHDPPLEAHGALIAEAASIEDVDAARAGEMYLTAAWACMNKGHGAPGIAAGRHACALLERAASPLAAPGRALVAAFDLCDGVPDAARRLTEAADALRDGPPMGIAGIEWDARTAHPLIWIDEHLRAADLLARSIGGARRLSALAALPFPLARRAELAFRTGDWEHAYADAAEAVQLADDTRQHIVAYCHVTLALIEAGRGRTDACRLHAARGRDAAAMTATGSVDAYARAAEGLLAVGRCDDEGAAAVLEPLAELVAADGLREPGVIRWAPDLIEAYARAGRRADARRRLDVFLSEARATGRAWPLATAARCEGLLAEDGYEQHFERAIGLTPVVPMPFEVARSELCWGERLRREKKRAAARPHLERAAAIFERLGASAFADRTREELTRAGARPTASTRPALGSLTGQEMKIALLVSEGARNREIAGTLFLSVKTIEAHLHTIYRKLGIDSRTQLAALVVVQRRDERAEGPSRADA